MIPEVLRKNAMEKEKTTEKKSKGSCKRTMYSEIFILIEVEIRASKPFEA